MRVLARLLLVLLLVVTTTSAWVRLSQSGLSCAGAPDCYATKSARSAADVSTSVAVARTLHRMTASAAGAVVVALLFFGWRTGTGAERAATTALGVLAVGLATLGSVTPSGLPAVTLGNLLGGLTMVGLAAWLAGSLQRRPVARVARRLRPWAWMAITLVALQAAVGGMISAHHAAFACEGFPLCGGRLWPADADLRAFDPLRELAPPAEAAQRAEAPRQAVTVAHRMLAVATLGVLAWVGLRSLRAGLPVSGRALLALAAAQLVLGVGQALLGQSLGLAIAHNLAAALVVATLAFVVERSRAPATG